MKHRQFDVTLTITAPLLSRTSTAGGHGIDALMARGSFLSDAGEVVEKYYLPFSHLKGLLRESWQELAALDKTYETWLNYLGRITAKGEWDPDSGTLFFDDLVHQGADPDATLRYRIAIEEMRGAADPGKLLVIESPFQPGEEIKFKGRIRLTHGDQFQFQDLKTAIRTGLYWTRSAGSMRSTGFGSICHVSVGNPNPRHRGELEMPRTNTWRLRLSFTQPFCFAKRQIDGNFFESEEFVPGAAIKAAVATMISKEPSLFQELRDELYKVRFTHAYPAVKGGECPRQWPLSLIAFGSPSGPVFEDLIRKDECATRDGQAGKFDIDWKERPEWESVRAAYGWPKLTREIRVHTAIRGEARSAREAALFAQETVVPFGFEWVGEVGTESLTPAGREQLCQVLRMGLQPLGKTKTFAVVAVSEYDDQTVDTAEDYAITLTSPALLIDSSRKLARQKNEPGSKSADDMRAEYEAVWTELGNGVLTMANFFHRCYLAGGDYFSGRFQRRESRAGTYRPYLLCSAGSTFLLKAAAYREEEAKKMIEGWQKRGLPLTDSVKSFYGLNGIADDSLWRFCPYLPENGYGAIAVNQNRPAAVNNPVAEI